MSNLAPAVGIAIKLITFLSDQHEPIGVSEISRQLDINKNMIFRILNSLEEEGWVYANDEAKYRLTLLPFHTASKVITQLSVENVSAPYIFNLWKKHGESTYLGILNNDQVLYISHLDSTQSLRVAGILGGYYPLYCSAPGKTLLAYQNESYINKYLEGSFEKRTDNTITDKEDLKKELDIIRQQGYATDNEEYSSGIVCLCAPIFDYTGKAVAALGCSSPTVYTNINNIYEKIGKDIVEAAKSISIALGYDK